MSCLSAKIGDLLPFARNVFGCQFLIGREMNSLGPFPAETSREAWPDFEQSTCRGCLFMTEKDDCWCDVFRLQFGNLTNQSEILWENIRLPQA